VFAIIDKVTEKFLMAIKDIEKEKMREEKTYNKMGPAKGLPNQRLRLQSYTFDRLSNIEVRQMVTLLIGKKRIRVVMIVPGNSYLVETLEGNLLPRVINERYLKKFHPIVWQSA
jgi:hypothetical protein